MSLTNKLEGVRAIWRFDNKWELLLSRTLFRSHPLTVYRYAGMEILVDHGADDPSGLRNVLVSPMYRQFLGGIEAGGPLNVMDLGASAGGFPLLLQASGLRLKRLACVELNPNTFVRMRFNVERNLRCAFVAVPAAVCGDGRELEVVLGPGSTGDSIDGSPGEGGRPYRVPGITFDDAYRRAFDGETVDVCKIDIEGAEYEVFDAPGHGCISRCRHLIIEIHRREGRRPEEVLAELRRCGFALRPRDAKVAPDVYFLGNTDTTPGG
jgi:FkbM family methyltransferase